MKNRLTPMRDKMMLCKRRVIGCVSGFLKNTTGLAHSRRRPECDLMMNILPALTACHFSGSKLEMPPPHLERTGLLGFAMIGAKNYPELADFLRKPPAVQ